MLDAKDIEKIIRDAEIQYGIAKGDIVSRSRKHRIVLVRAYVAKKFRMMGMSLTDIGWFLGDRHHATIVQLLARYNDKININEEEGRTIVNQKNKKMSEGEDQVQPEGDLEAGADEGAGTDAPSSDAPQAEGAPEGGE